MNKSEKEVITQVIEDLIQLRKQQFDKQTDILIEKQLISDTFGVSSSFQEDNNSPKGKWITKKDESDEDNPFSNNSKKVDEPVNSEEVSDDISDQEQLWSEFISDYDVPLVKLNNLLEKKDKNQSVIDIEIQMTKINMKTHITPTEFSIKYNVSKSTQQEWRSQRKDPLPYNQKVVNGNILYVVKEVDQWFQNQ